MYRSLSVLILVCFVQFLSAKIVTKETLQNTIPHLTNLKGLNVTSVKTIETYSYNQQPAFYVTNFHPEGWILVAADDKADPVLAYSKFGKFEMANQPESMQAWLISYAKMIYEISADENLPMHGNWKELPSKMASANRDDAVEPLIKVKFNQPSPWNKYCPSDENGRAVVGCVAVAMAQAMTVHKYPERPNGFFSYSCPPYGNLAIDYSAEPAYNWDMIIAGTDGKDAAAKLLYHCGVSVEMGYSPSGSGTQTSKITSALKTFYAYPNSVKTYNRGSYDDDWENLIKNEILHGRPVVYSGNDGTGNPGHAFNLDGFDGSSMYHINWGWGGTNNGYYGINNVKDGQNDYTKNQQVIVGIRPPSVAPSDIIISKLYVPANQPAGTVVGSVTIDSEAVNPIYEYELKGPYSIFIHDYMPSSFYIENGELKTIRPFDLEDEQVPLSIKVTNTKNGLSYEKDFIIRIVEAPNAVDAVNADYTKLNFVLEGKNLILFDVNEKMQFNIYSLNGHRVLSGDLQHGTNSFDLSAYQPGYYMLQVAIPNIQPLKLLLK